MFWFMVPVVCIRERTVVGSWLPVSVMCPSQITELGPETPGHG